MTRLMGILNVTPDSFSGDGVLNVAQMRTRIADLRAAGADVIDVGAESTRPGATALSAEAEWARLAPIADVLAECADLVWSIDTYHPETARRAAGFGASYINDVSGGAPEMAAAAAESGLSFVVMHSLSVPADPRATLPPNTDAVDEVRRWMEETGARLVKVGIQADKLIFDPGIGFGKSAPQSWALLRRIEELQAGGRRLLVGHSRKSFLGASPATRDAATLAVSAHLAQHGVFMLRVHDVANHAAFFRTRDSL